jgi:ribonuclease P protein component
MSVGVKVAGNAVERNRIRRVIRESFRLEQQHLADLDIVVTARAGVRGSSNAQLRASLQRLWSPWLK